MNSMDRLGKRILAGASCVAFASSAALADSGNERYFDHHGMMGWGVWFYGPVMMLLFFVLLVGTVVLLVRFLGSDTLRSDETRDDRAHTILRERFAKGEITKEEFETSRKILDGGAS